MLIVKNHKPVSVIIVGNGKMAGSAAKDLVKDIKKVTNAELKVIKVSKVSKDLIAQKNVILIGSPKENVLVKTLAEKGKIRISSDFPGPQGFILKTAKDAFVKGKDALIIAGSDDLGSMYGVYAFSQKYLGVDPAEFFTGLQPKHRRNLEIDEFSHVEKPPVFKIRGYFHNDVDELANWRGKPLHMDFDLWKELIDTLARLRINCLDLFDDFGRAEFNFFEPYIKICPDYKPDLKLVYRVIDYARSKGMKIAASSLWAYGRYPYEKKCWSRYKEEYKKFWDKIISEAAKWAEIFYVGFRDPWWDAKYFCDCKACRALGPGSIATEAIDEQVKIVLKHKPDAILVTTLWAEGNELFASGKLKLPEKVLPCFSDDGYGRLIYLPEKKDRKYGLIFYDPSIYLNHLILDPYPERIEENLRKAADKGCTELVIMEGTTFKNFVLNFEACCEALWDPYKFDGEEFYLRWCTEQFGEKAAPLTVKSLKKLHDANDKSGGIVVIFWALHGYIAFLEHMIPPKMDKLVLSALSLSKFPPDAVRNILDDIEDALALAKEAEKCVSKDRQLYFDDYVLFQEKVFAQSTWVLYHLSKVMEAYVMGANKRKGLEYIDLALENLIKLHSMLEQGPEWDKWRDWYKVSHLRNAPPNVDELQEVKKLLESVVVID